MNRNVLKLFLLFFMTLDHIAFRFLSIYTVPYQIMRFLGRSVAITMCYLLVEGFEHTSNRSKYLVRLLIFAVLAYFPYILVADPSLNDPLWFLDFNMLFNLANCFVLLMVLEKLKADNNLQIFLVIFASCIIGYNCDWLIFAPLWVANFYLNKGKVQDCCTLLICGMSMLYTAIYSYSRMADISTVLQTHIFCIGTLLFFLYRKIYNHQPGRHKFKYLFYAYYPLHLTIIVVVYYLIALHCI